MVVGQVHADVALLVLHGGDICRETLVTSQGWPVWPEVTGWSGFALGMIAVAPAGAVCGGHALILRQPDNPRQIGGRQPRTIDGRPRSCAGQGVGGALIFFTVKVRDVES